MGRIPPLVYRTGVLYARQGIIMKSEDTVTQRYLRLGKAVKSKTGLMVPAACKHCQSVWKLVTVQLKGKKIIKRRVTCYMCGKRQYGKRAETSRT